MGTGIMGTFQVIKENKFTILVNEKRKSASSIIEKWKNCLSGTFTKNALFEHQIHFKATAKKRKKSLRKRSGKICNNVIQALVAGHTV